VARPKKQTVDYFPHSCTHSKTMFILEQKYGNDGYAFWFKLLEMLGNSEGHCLYFTNGMDWEFLIAKTRLDKEKCIEILNLLATFGAIDKKLWSKKIVWSDNFIENIKDAYRNRTVNIPIKPSFLRKKSTSNRINDVNNPHIILNEMKVNNNIIGQIISYLNLKAKKNFRSDSKIAVKNITARLNEKYTIEDFKKVIDIKCSHWLNPKKGEPDMSIYLSPDTLFGNKFEKYLNQNANREAIQEAKIKEKNWEKIKEKKDDYKHTNRPEKITKEVYERLAKVSPKYRDKLKKLESEEK